MTLIVLILGACALPGGPRTDEKDSPSMPQPNVDADHWCRPMNYPIVSVAEAAALATNTDLFAIEGFAAPHAGCNFETGHCPRLVVSDDPGWNGRAGPSATAARIELAYAFEIPWLEVGVRYRFSVWVAKGGPAAYRGHLYAVGLEVGD